MQKMNYYNYITHLYIDVKTMNYRVNFLLGMTVFAINFETKLENLLRKSITLVMTIFCSLREGYCTSGVTTIPCKALT